MMHNNPARDSHAWRLRVLHGPNWSLPIKIERMAGMVRVRACGTITDAMLRTVEARIAELGTSNGQDWFMTEQTLDLHADRVPAGTHADDCISWVTYRARVTLTEQPAGMSGFYENFVRAGYAKSVQHAQMLYGAWCQHLLDWLVVEGKPAELGFATLEAIPVRADWATIVARRLRLLGRTSMDEKLRGILTDGTLTMFDTKKNILFWSIGVRHRKAWWAGTLKKELNALKRIGPNRYMVRILEHLKAKQEPLYEIFKEWVSQTNRATLFIPKRVGKSSEITRKIIKPKVRDVAKLFKVGPVTGTIDRRFGRKGQSPVVGQTVKNLPLLSGIQPRSEDLRDCVQESEEPPMGAEG